MTRFTIPLTWEVEEGKEYDLIISGDYQGANPGRISGPPDAWEEPEGPTVENLAIRYEQGGSMAELDQAELTDIGPFNDAVLEAVEDELRGE